MVYLHRGFAGGNKYNWVLTQEEKDFNWGGGEEHLNLLVKESKWNRKIYVLLYLGGLSPRANDTHRATAACQRS
jgi:hypothetical protein